MKKCVKCNREFDDSFFVCEDCGLPLTENTVSDLIDNSSRPGSVRRRNRVVPIDESDISDDSVFDTSFSKQTRGFEPSDEVMDLNSNDDVFPVRYGNRNNSILEYNTRHHIRRAYYVVRIIVPVLLLVVAIIWMAVNWAVVSDFIQCCLISGIVGGGLLTFLSIRYGHHFSIDAVTVGVIGGMIVGCILKYNIFESADKLSDLFIGMGPCVIIIIGIYIAVRSIFR